MRAVRPGPQVTTCVALECPGFRHSHRTSFDPQPTALNQRSRHFPSGRFNHAAERRARYVHPLCGFLLVQALKVRKAKRLQFVDGEDIFRKVRAGHQRSEAGAARRLDNSPVGKGSCHICFPCAGIL